MQPITVMNYEYSESAYAARNYLKGGNSSIEDLSTERVGRSNRSVQYGLFTASVCATDACKGQNANYMMRVGLTRVSETC